MKPSSRAFAIARPDAAQREHGLLVAKSLRLALLLRDACPRDLGIRVRDGGNLARVEPALLPGGGLCGDVPLVRRLVREHRRACDVADREDVRRRSCASACRRGCSRVRSRPRRRARRRCACRSACARPRRARGRRAAARSCACSPSKRTSMPSFVAVADDGLRLQHHVVEARRVELLPHLHEVAVRARHEPVEHLDDVEARAERRVHRRHLEADDAAADDEHPPRRVAELERAGGVDDARIVRQERQPRGLRARRDDRLLRSARPSSRRSSRARCPSSARPRRGSGRGSCRRRARPRPCAASPCPASPLVSFFTTAFLKPRSPS